MENVNSKNKVENKKKNQLTVEQQIQYETSEQEKQMDQINEQLKKKDYVLTVYQTGDEMMSLSKRERQVFPRRYYVVCSLEEIPEYIEYMKKPYWEHEDGLSKKEIKDYPYEKKKWGRNWNVVIEPLSEELEKNYLSASKEGFFETWRMFHQEESDEVL